MAQCGHLGEAATVGTPVTRRPRCSPGRAVFPPPVPRSPAPAPPPTPGSPWPREVGSCYSGVLTCPGCVFLPGCVRPVRPSPWGGLTPPPRPRLDPTPQPPTVGLALCGPSSSPACLLVHRAAQVPAWCRLRVAPAVPHELSTRPPSLSPAGPGPPHVLRRLASCLPRPADSGGPAPPRPSGWAACGLRERETPRRPPPAPWRSCPSTSGAAAPPAASRGYAVSAASLCVRQGRDPPTPPWTPDAIRVGGSP